MTRVFCTSKRASTNVFLKLKLGLSSSEFVQHDQRSARNLMVIARMPADRSTTFKNRQQRSKTFKAICTSVCTPVGPA
eukprot:3364299-Heterocapsa_arctica.AAC.1